MPKPYQMRADKQEGGWRVCVCSKRKGKLLPITTGTYVTDAEASLPNGMLLPVRIELEKAGVPTNEDGSYLLPVPVNDTHGDVP